MLSIKIILALAGWALFCFFLQLSGTMSFTVPVAAQDIQKNSTTGSIGSYFSVAGAFYKPIPFREIQESEDDVMPIPLILFSIKYKKNFEAIIGWEDDNDNENLLKFFLRYNKYANNNMYIFGGPVLWYFNKKFHFTKFICNEYDYEENAVYSLENNPLCKPGSLREVEIKTDRPDGTSIAFGIISGLGIEYKLGFFVFSHEFELFFSPCQYRDFVCFGGDFKFLGVHFEF